jgi:hypothetical protein
MRRPVYVIEQLDSPDPGDQMGRLAVAGAALHDAYRAAAALASRRSNQVVGGACAQGIPGDVRVWLP